MDNVYVHINSPKTTQAMFFQTLIHALCYLLPQDNNQEINNITVSITFHISGWFFLHFF